MSGPMEAANQPAPSLAFCEILEQEYEAITGIKPDEPPAVEFTPEQILDPERLQERLKDGPDRASRGMRALEVQGTVVQPTAADVANDREALKRSLTARLNKLLDTKDLYERDGSRPFRGVRFRSQTLDRLSEPTPERNRLILEDTFPEVEKLHDIRLKRMFARIHREKFAALCLSGGGIRSATFGLGVIQGLARHDLLDKFDFLSTVSGGGYIGGWLTAWIHHTTLAQVIGQLQLSSQRPLEPEPEPIWHLRDYSNYLSPKLGLLSADTWTLVATYLRNLFLSWLVLIPPVVGVLTIPLLLTLVLRWAPEDWLSLQAGIGGLLAVAALVCGVLTVRYVHANRPISRDGTEGIGLDDQKRDQRAFLRQCLAPLVFAALGGTICWAWAAPHAGDLPLSGRLWMLFILIGTSVHLGGWSLAIRRWNDEGGWEFIRRLVKEGLFTGIIGGGAGGLAWVAASRTLPLLDRSHGPEIYASIAVPCLLILILIFSHIYIGFSSGPKGRQVDAEREWSARFSAWLLIVLVAWLVGFGLVLLGPWLSQYLRANGDRVLLAAKWVGGALGAISGVVTLRAGHGAGTPAKANGAGAGAPMTLALALAAPTFVGFLIVVLGWAGSALVGGALELAPQILALVERGWSHLAPGSMTPTLASFHPGSGAAVVAAIGVSGVLVGFGYWAATRIDTNKFSLHAMYRARLIRAYLGASRPAGERDPNRFTGFDDGDNLPMRDLWTRPPARPAEAERRPLHVVNAALNLVGGGKLAWQERKAESFTFTPLFCGAYNLGYRPTWGDQSENPRGYGGRRGVSLGTAITISGAAASPNMGYHSSPVISLLLSLFNLRLGWWLGNPGHAGQAVYTRSSPESSLALVRDEAFGLTDDKNPYVYLSDGGHFENLGLYEMVLRRCHTIVVSDASCDPGCGFGDLGNAIRKIRIDMGIPIEFGEMPIYPREPGGPAKPGKYCSVGTIRYSAVDPGAPDGTLIYLKPAFYGDEPKDVFNYAKACGDFPHETTGDQFFSESQFESYRALGSYVIDQIVPAGPQAGNLPEKSSLSWFVRKTSTYLRPTPEGDEKPKHAADAEADRRRTV